MTPRALHFVYKIGHRAKTMSFYRDVLKMKPLRHEEFDEGCIATCNGPYDGKWSKTMIGYGNEDDNFVVELTYNYGIREYKLGNDYNYLEITSKSVFDNIKSGSYPYALKENGHIELFDPNGYKFLVISNEDNTTKVTAISLFTSDINKARDYWNGVLEMELYDNNDPSCLTLGFSKDQAKVKLVCHNQPINHETAYGRIAFSRPRSTQKPLQDRINEKGLTVLTPLVMLDTPGKRTVQVVILGDPDGHEICFVEDEGFRDLSKMDSNADEMLDKSMLEDKSDEAIEKQNRRRNMQQK